MSVYGPQLVDLGRNLPNPAIRSSPVPPVARSFIAPSPRASKAAANTADGKGRT
jgi:hypothetical protein